MKETKGTKVLLSDPVTAIPKLALPLAIAILVQNLNSAVDALWASWLGSAAVAGIGFAFPLHSTIIGIGNGLAIGVAAAEARAVGTGDRDGASRYAGQSFTLSLSVAVALALPLVVFAAPLMRFIGSGDVTDEALSYGLPIFAFGFFLISSAVMSGILRGEGAVRASMAIQIAGVATNIVLDPVLMYGFDMGVSGAGWATVIAGAVTLVLGLSIYRMKHSMYVMLRVRDLKPSWKVSKDILVVGAPEMAEYAAMALLNIPMNFIVSGVGGSGAVAIYTSSWRIAYVALVPAQAIAGSVVSVCSSEYSRKKGELIRRAFSFGVRLSVKYTVLMSALMILLSYPLATMFTLSDDLSGLRDEMVALIILQAIMLPSMSQVFVGSAYLQSLEHSTVGFLSSFVRNVWLVLGYILVAKTFHCTMAIWVVCCAVELVGGVLMWVLARKYVKEFASCNSGAPMPGIGSGG